MDSTSEPVAALSLEECWQLLTSTTLGRIAVSAASEIDEAETAPLQPWIPTLKYRFVRITPTDITGRSFQPGPEPERY